MNDIPFTNVQSTSMSTTSDYIRAKYHRMKAQGVAGNSHRHARQAGRASGALTSAETGQSDASQGAISEPAQVHSARKFSGQQLPPPPYFGPATSTAQSSQLSDPRVMGGAVGGNADPPINGYTFITALPQQMAPTRMGQGPPMAPVQSQPSGAANLGYETSPNKCPAPGVPPLPIRAPLQTLRTSGATLPSNPPGDATGAGGTRRLITAI